MPKQIPQIKSFQLSEGKTSIKQIGILLGVSLFFIGLILLGTLGLDRQAENIPVIKKENTATLSSVLEKENKTIEMPKGFPENLPIADPKNILESYVRDRSTGDITVVLESSNSVKDIFDYYVDYGNKNGWTVDEARESKDSQPAKVLLRKDKMIITLVLSEKENGSEVTISSTSLVEEIISESMDIKNLNLSK